MRLPDRFRRDESSERLAAEVERDLQAVDGALAGLEMHPDFDELATLAVAIRDERPTVDEEFAALLDERAAAGFPRAKPDMRAPAPLANVRERLAAMRPSRLLTVAGAAASLLVVVGVSVSVLKSSNDGSSLSSVPAQTTTAPATTAGTAHSSASAASETATSAGGGGSGAGELRSDAPGSLSNSLDELRPTVKSADRTASGGFAPLAAPSLNAPRKVAQKATLTLSTDPEKVRTIASSVTDIVNRYHGLVISSSITSGKGTTPPSGPEPLPFSTGALGAEFQLRIPANNLDAALDDLSKLGLVVSREQGTQDITGRFVDTRKQIQDLTDERDQLISQLGQAVTQEAIDAINARLKAVRNEIDHAQSNLGHLQQRVAVVPVHVSVVAKGSGGSSGDDGFDIGDAVHDAGRVLEVVVGILLVSLAVAVPFGLIAAIAWFAISRTRRSRRDRALD